MSEPRNYQGYVDACATFNQNENTVPVFQAVCKALIELRDLKYTLDQAEKGDSVIKARIDYIMFEVLDWEFDDNEQQMYAKYDGYEGIGCMLSN